MITAEEFSRLINVKKAEKDIKSDRDICRAIGIVPASMSHYRKRPGSCPVPVLSRLCTYLGMTVEERGRILM